MRSRIPGRPPPTPPPEVVREIRDEEWGLRRFFVREPGGRVVNVLSHRAWRTLTYGEPQWRRSATPARLLPPLLRGRGPRDGQYGPAEPDIRG